MIRPIKRLIPQSIKQNIRLLPHRGHKHVCPLCGFKARDWRSIGLEVPVLRERQVIGAGKRLAGCHKCGSSDRERLVYLFLRDHLDVFSKPNLRVLHLAPERNLSRVLLRFGFRQYACGDLFTEGYNYPAHVQSMNVLDLPFQDETFDLIICNHLLEHVPEDQMAMNSLFRTLKPGGQAILQVPISQNTDSTLEDFSITDSAEREIAFGQFDHVRIYGQDYPKRLIRCGFEVDRINISGNYPSHGLNEAEDIFFATKPVLFSAPSSVGDLTTGQFESASHHP